MNKKLILSSVCGVLALVMVGCSSNSSAQAAKDLNSQLDRMQKTMSSISSSAIYDVTPSNYLYGQPMSNENNSTNRLKALMTESQFAFAEHEALRQEINSRCSTLKSALTNKYKLSTNKVKALKTLTSAMSGQINDINNTTYRVRNATGLIKRSKDLTNVNSDGLNVGYTQLNNELEKRVVFFKNVLATFDQVEAILSDAENVDKAADKTSNNDENTSNQTQNDSSSSENKKNIDTYGGNAYNGTAGSPNVNYAGYNNGCYGNGCNGGVNNYYGNGIGYYGNGINGYGMGYGVNGYGVNGYGMNGYGMNGFGTGYGFNRAYSPFNRGRNTDTYLPLRRNIDTYRPIVPEIVDNGAVVATNENVNINENDVEDVDEVQSGEIEDKIEEAGDGIKKEIEAGESKFEKIKHPRRIRAKTQEVFVYGN